MTQRIDDTELTPRQLAVLQRLTEGRSNQEIAESMHLTEYTIKYHCRALYHRYDVTNRYELMSALVRRYIAGDRVTELPVGEEG